MCGSKEGGWTRVAYLNMSDSIQSCPSGFKLYHVSHHTNRTSRVGVI